MGDFVPSTWISLINWIVEKGSASPLLDIKYPVEYLDKCSDMGILRPFNRKRLNPKVLTVTRVTTLAKFLEENTSTKKAKIAFTDVMAGYLSYYSEYKSLKEIQDDLDEVKAEIKAITLRSKKYPELAEAFKKKLAPKAGLEKQLMKLFKAGDSKFSKTADASSRVFLLKATAFYNEHINKDITVNDLITKFKLSDVDLWGKDPLKFSKAELFAIVLVRLFDLRGKQDKPISLSKFQEYIKDKNSAEISRSYPSVHIDSWMDYEKMYEIANART